jgi:hypothetical protein
VLNGNILPMNKVQLVIFDFDAELRAVLELGRQKKANAGQGDVANADLVGSAFHRLCYPANRVPIARKPFRFSTLHLARSTPFWRPGKIMIPHADLKIQKGQTCAKASVDHCRAMSKAGTGSFY